MELLKAYFQDDWLLNVCKVGQNGQSKGIPGAAIVSRSGTRRGLGKSSSTIVVARVDTLRSSSTGMSNSAGSMGRRVDAVVGYREGLEGDVGATEVAVGNISCCEDGIFSESGPSAEPTVSRAGFGCAILLRCSLLYFRYCRRFVMALPSRSSSHGCSWPCLNFSFTWPTSYESLNLSAALASALAYLSRATDLPVSIEILIKRPTVSATASQIASI